MRANGANESGNTQAVPSSLDGTKAFLIAVRILILTAIYATAFAL